jgi:ribosomal protein L10
MNKSNLKKKIESNNLDNLIKNCHFIGFFCMQNIAVNDKTRLKKNLNKQGFKYTLIKNTVIFKSFFKSIPKMRGIVSGSLAICYSVNEVSSNVGFTSLKEVFSIIKKEKNIFFLGGFYEGSLINRLFEVKVCTLKSLDSVNLDYISLIQNILTNLNKITSKSKNQLSLLLSNKID